MRKGLTLPDPISCLLSPSSKANVCFQRQSFSISFPKLTQNQSYANNHQQRESQMNTGQSLPICLVRSLQTEKQQSCNVQKARHYRDEGYQPALRKH